MKILAKLNDIKTSTFFPLNCAIEIKKGLRLTLNGFRVNVHVLMRVSNSLRCSVLTQLILFAIGILHIKYGDKT